MNTAVLRYDVNSQLFSKLISGKKSDDERRNNWWCIGMAARLQKYESVRSELIKLNAALKQNSLRPPY